MFKKVDNQDIIEEELTDGSIKRYVKGKLLGKGGFAKCYEVTSLQTQKKYAAKIIDKAGLQKSKAKDKLLSEIKIHKSLTHKYVVGFEHFFEDSEYVYILLEKCSNQTLNEVLKRRKRLTDIQTKYYIYQLAAALEYIHEQMIIHRDLKLGNLFLSDKLQLKIGDFGLASKLNYKGQRKKTKCGTPNYIAPQILDDKKNHSYEVDIWSLGVIAYTLLVGRPPFESNDLKTTYNRIKTCNYIFPESSNLSESSKNFISKMLQLQPSKRPTIQEILCDPFLIRNSIPQSLPLSTLACPPSFDFLKKYRQAEVSKKEEDTLNNNSIHCLQEHQKSCQKNKSRDKSVKISNNKLATRVESVNKAASGLNRVFSAANLNTVSKPKKIKTSTLNQLERDSQKIWISYYEENPKFGLGYLLNSNVTGFRYNDATNLITNHKNSHVKYCGRDKKCSLGVNKQAERELKEGVIITFAQIEEEEPKKFKILIHFDRQLKKLKQQKEDKLSNNARIKLESSKFREDKQSEMGFYVVRYHITNKSIIFWFNIKAYQIIFEDRSEILISPKGVITYLNKFGERVYFYDKDRQNQSPEIKKRLEHLYGVIEGRLKKQSKTNSINSENGLKQVRNTTRDKKNCSKNGQLGNIMKKKESMKSIRLSIKEQDMNCNSQKNNVSYKMLEDKE